MAEDAGAGEGEAQRFARLMRELKERAGLSYGVLARKLHTSTSTLHRYCNGEAVPTEFAVVDRFARLCGARPPEAVELHRAWLLADARRRAAARAVPVPVPVPLPVVVPEPGREPEPDRVAEPVPVSEAAPAVEAPSVAQAAAGVPEPEAQPEPAEAAEVGRVDVPEPVRPRWYRRRGAAVAVAGAAAGAVAVAVLTAALPDRGTPSAGAGPAASAPPSAPSRAATDTAAPQPTAPESGAVSAPPTGPATVPAAPQGSAAGSAPAQGPAPSGGTGPGTAPAAGTPLRAAVRTHVWASGCDHAYLAAQGPGALPPPPVEADAAAWASSQRAVHAGTQIVEVTLHGTGPGAVVLEDLEVRVSARRTPLTWNVYQMSQGCGGALTPAKFTVNLDAPRPLARPVAGNDSGSALPAPAFPLRVSASEPVVLRIEAATEGCDCDWSLDLRWTGPSGSGTLRVDDNGRPLRTSATKGRPVYGYATEQGRWAR
ncbi:helix-turn-helix domain-containing protein [Streptomyces xanthophaeus]